VRVLCCYIRSAAAVEKRTFSFRRLLAFFSSTLDTYICMYDTHLQPPWKGRGAQHSTTPNPPAAVCTEPAYICTCMHACMHTAVASAMCGTVLYLQPYGMLTTGPDREDAAHELLDMYARIYVCRVCTSTHVVYLHIDICRYPDT